MRGRPGTDGMGQVVIDLTSVEMARAVAAVEAPRREATWTKDMIGRASALRLALVRMATSARESRT